MINNRDLNEHTLCCKELCCDCSIVPTDGNVHVCRERERERDTHFLLWYTFYMYSVPLSTQLTQDNVPTDNLDPLALSIMQDIGSDAKTVSEAREDPLVKQYITDGMSKANEESVSRAAKVQVRLLAL